MLLISCPWCGPRDEAEFHYGGQAHVPYPEDPPAALTDEEWARYLFFRDNPQGPVRRTLEPHGRLPQVVQRPAQHGDERDPGDLQAGRAPTADT